MQLTCEYWRSFVLILLTTALGSVTLAGSGTMTAAAAAAGADFHVMVETGVCGGVGCAVCTTVSCWWFLAACTSDGGRPMFWYCVWIWAAWAAWAAS